MEVARPKRDPRAVPAYPLAIAAAVVLGAYDGTQVPVDQLWRPLLVLVLGTVVLMLIGGRLTRRWHGVALLLAAANLAAIGVWQLLGLLLAARVFMAWRSVRMRSGFGRTAALTRPLNVLAGAWVVVAAVTAIGTATAPPPQAPAPADLPTAGPRVAGPAIYVVLLDGYPRADTLDEYFGYDNDPFLGALEERGFHVSSASWSNSTRTFTTVVSTLHMASAESLGLGGDLDTWDERQRVHALINASPAIATLRAAGYQVTSIPPGGAPLDLREADIVREHRSALTPFEFSLLDGGAFALVGTDWLYEYRRNTVNAAFDALASVARDPPERQRFVWAHVMNPHAPYVFTADGGPARPFACLPWCGFGTAEMPRLGMTLDQLSDLLIGQIEHVNARVLETVDAILAADPAAVIVLFSDHGARLDPADPDEWHRILFAAHTPGHPALFGDDPTPTTLFPTLFNAYLGTDLPGAAAKAP